MGRCKARLCPSRPVRRTRALPGTIPQAAGLIDCHLYRQSNSLIVHLVNLTNGGAWRGPIDELIPVGPLQMRIKAPSDLHIRKVESLVSRTQPPLMNQQDWVSVEVKQILDHEVLVLS